MTPKTDGILQFVGTVTKEIVSVESKSERQAVILETAIGPIYLRRAGGNPYKDDVLDTMVGKKVWVEGKQHKTVFMISSWKEVK